MRPGHDGPGNDLAGRKHDITLAASMRPGHDGPGNDGSEKIVEVKVSELQ